MFYHLGELDQALTYALGAGGLFDITEQTEYVQTILCECDCPGVDFACMYVYHTHHLLISV